MEPTAEPEENAITFACEGRLLVGVLSGAAVASELGVLIVVGGPQYRVGSHRQFALLARRLAGNGIPTLRFDYRGMGDSEGESHSFESVEADIRCAIDQLVARVSTVKQVVIWGLCDAASAALFYAHLDPRVIGLVLLNPWVRTPQGAARVQLRHYYLTRVFQAGFWRKLAGGKLQFRATLESLVQSIADAFGASGSKDDDVITRESAPLPDRMANGLERFKGAVLLILSGNDLTAQEFKDVVASSRRWQRLLADPRVTRFDLPEANHTFARRDWRDQVARWTEEWVKAC